MNVMDFKKQLVNKTLNPFYIFTGEETAILNIFLNNVKQYYNLPVVYADSVSSVYSQLCNTTLLSSQGTLYIIRDDKNFQTASESVWNHFNKKSFFKQNKLILIYTSLDKRNKFYKTFENNIVLFDKLSVDVLTKYIKKDINLSTENCRYLIDVCNGCYNLILLEIDKLQHIIKSCNCTADKAFDIALDNNLIYIPPESDVFGLVNAILKRIPKDVFYELQQHKLRNDNNLGLLSILHTNVKNLLQVQLCQDIKDIGNTTGLQGYQIKNCYNYLNIYSDYELIRFLKIIKYCEQSIKNGTMDSEITLDYLVVNVL